MTEDVSPRCTCGGTEWHHCRQDLRALAHGYRWMYEQAVAGLLRIVDETSSRDEAVDAARDALREVGVGADE